MDLFKNYVKKHLIYFLSIIILTISTSLIDIPLPYISKILTDNVILKHNYYYLPKLILIFSAIIILHFLLGLISVKLNANFFQNFANQLRESIYSNIVIHKINSKVNFGKLQTVVLNDVELLTSNFMNITSIFFGNVTLLIGYIAVLFFINVKLTIICLSFIPIYLIWITFVSNKLKILNKEYQISKDNLLKTLNITINNLLVIKIYNYFKTRILTFHNNVKDNGNLNKNIMIYQYCIGIVSSSIITLATFLPLFLGVLSIKSGEITIGDLIAFYSYCGLLFSPVTSIIGLITILKTSQVYNNRVQSLLNNNDVEYNNAIAKVCYNSDYILKINNYSLFTDKKLLLENVEFMVYPGQTILLTGNNGVGKSLFFKSIIQLYNSYEGEIIYGIKNIRNCSFEAISKKIIYINNEQNMVLNSLEEELLYNSLVNEEEMSEIIKYVGLDNRIAALPNGINTKIEIVQEQFSTGEMQRFRIARALTRKPEIILLDEIFSNIDKRQVIEIIKNIRNAFPRISIVLIEHHISVNLNIDLIFRIENKKIIQIDPKSYYIRQ